MEDRSQFTSNTTVHCVAAGSNGSFHVIEGAYDDEGSVIVGLEGKTKTTFSTASLKTGCSHSSPDRIMTDK